MSKPDSGLDLEAMEAKKARLLEQAAALDRDMAILERIAREHNLEIRPKKLGADRSEAPPPPSSSPKTRKRTRVATTETVSSLIDRYVNDKGSPFHGLRFRTREHYLSLIKRINESLGEQKLADLKAEDFERVYEEWIAKSAVRGRGDGIAMAHALVTMLRTLVNYGTGFVENTEFLRLSHVLHRIRFKTTKPSKKEGLSDEQVDALGREAHKNKWHSLALAQAIQFYAGLHQRDVIGEWVPVAEPGVSDILDKEYTLKWLRGLRWDDIDKDWILRHVTSRKTEEIEVRLSDFPKVMTEFSKMGARQLSGPVIINEDTGLPYVAWEFRRRWRILAKAIGLPEHIKNMNSRRSKNAHSQDAASAAEATA